MTGKKKETVVENGLIEAVAITPEEEQDIVLIVNGKDVSDKLVESDLDPRIPKRYFSRFLPSGAVKSYTIPDMGKIFISGKSQVSINTEKTPPYILSGPASEKTPGVLHIHDSDVELGGFFGTSSIIESQVEIDFINSATLRNVKSEFNRSADLRSVVKSSLHEVTFTGWANKNNDGLVIYKSDLNNSKISLSTERITKSSISKSEISIKGQITDASINSSNIVLDTLDIGTEDGKVDLWNIDLYAYRNSIKEIPNSLGNASIRHPVDVLEYSLGRFKFGMVPIRTYDGKISGYILAIGGTSCTVNGDENSSPTPHDVIGCLHKNTYRESNPGEDYLLDAFYANVSELIISRMRIISITSSLLR